VRTKRARERVRYFYGKDPKRMKMKKKRTYSRHERYNTSNKTNNVQRIVSVTFCTRTFFTKRFSSSYFFSAPRVAYRNLQSDMPIGPIGPQCVTAAAWQELHREYPPLDSAVARNPREAPGISFDPSGTSRAPQSGLLSKKKEHFCFAVNWRHSIRVFPSG